MKILRWLEEKIVTGATVRDFGVVHESGTAAAGEIHSLRVCHIRGKDVITIKHTSHRRFSEYSVSYTTIPVELAGPLAAKFAEIAASQSNVASPNQSPEPTAGLICNVRQKESLHESPQNTPR